MTQPKLTSRQARWQELLSEFHFLLEYRAGSCNHVADALSRRGDFTSLVSVAALSSSAVATCIRYRPRELLPKDSAAQGLVHLVEQGKARQFWLDDGLLITKGNRLYVPKGGDLRKSLISECHDTLWAGHQGEERTYALVQRAYYWPQMRDDVETYVRTCLICQQDKADHQKKAGLLQSLPIPTRSWESVSMDYISGLPKVGDLGSIIVVVNRLSKYATFIAAPKHVTAEGTAHLFFKHIIKYWGLPSRPQLELTKIKEKVAEAILNHRVTRTAKREHTEYLVKWKGCSSEENTWERVTNLKAFLPCVEAYHASHAPRTSLSRVGENVKGRPHTRPP
ncbi:UNVERIFIED_CONTAM: Transposon Tf2-11 polyprotein [Sesamum radiatum]|uniref:Transposon Tf2-11 polyprotein n=1 Tax=Sesamum radiatum TaxID=300843 RepID=A0AAW2RGP4_SESRA